MIAVVDPAGDLLELRRTEDAQAASVEVGIDKARTAAIFVRPSREIEEQVSGGRLGRSPCTAPRRRRAACP